MKRFFDKAACTAAPNGFAIKLDGKPVRTPRGEPLVLRSKPLATAVAAEWDAVPDPFNPADLPLTKLVNTALDRTATVQADVVAELVKYAETDLICYRAQHPDALVALQSQHWDPVLDWLAHHHGIKLEPTTALIGHSQPTEALNHLKAHLQTLDCFELTGMHSLSTALGSVSLALAHRAGYLKESETWAAASVDEAFQMAHWGEDSEAQIALDARKNDFLTASMFCSLYSRAA
ncbi:MAG: ATP12 family protein [Pseudomonadota bacterium]